MFIPDYKGNALPIATVSFLEILERHGFAINASGSSRKTIRIQFDNIPRGYINSTVLSKGAVVGYNFATWGRPHDDCPMDQVDALVPSFQARYHCDVDAFLTHKGNGEIKRNKVYLLLCDASVALTVLLQDAGVQASQDVVVAKHNGRYLEGSVRDVTMTVAERSSRARAACISHYGYSCFVCKTLLRNQYSGLPLDLIHVHHEILLSSRKEETLVDPINEMKPVCPNCHAVIHSRNPPYSMAEMHAICLVKAA